MKSLTRTVEATACLVFAVLTGAQAEVQVTGKVANANSAPLGGARITLKRVLPLGSWQAFTDPTGAYSVQVPTPDDYTATVEREGYFSLENRPLSLWEGSNEVNFVLEPVREVVESVEVSASSTVIDMDSTDSQEQLTGTQLLNIPYPNTNTLRNAMRIMPGVVEDSRGGIHINGGSEDQVQYTLDGFNISDPLTGRFESRLSVESVQSLDVSSGTYSAQYGKGSAGTLAINTKIGDDKLRYGATNFVPGVENRKGLIIGNWTPRLNLSGPIKKGKAWFSNSFDTQYINHIVEELPKGEDRTTSWRFTNLLNAQVNLTPSNILYAGFLSNYWNAPRSGLGVLDPLETTSDRRARQWFTHVKDQIYFGRGALVEFGYAANRTFGRDIPQGRELFFITPEGKRGNHFVDATRKAARDQILVNAFLPTLYGAGAHQIKTGIDLNRVIYWQDIDRTGFANFRPDNTLLRRTVFGGTGRLSQGNFEAGYYAQDSWRPRSDLLLEAGFRLDWDRILRRWSPAPRFGVAWAPPGTSHTKISGGYGTIYDATSLRLFTRPMDQHSITTYFDRVGNIVRGPALSLFTIDDPVLRRPRYGSWSAGLEQRLFHGLFARLHYLRKRGRDGLTYVNLLSADQRLPPEKSARFQTADFDAVYGLTNERRDVFDSFEVTLRQNLRKQYEWMVSYTRSRALSNAVSDVSVDDPVIVDHNVGPMPWDSPNRFLASGYMPTFLKDWAVAYFLEWRDGFPFSIQNDDGRVVGNVNSFRFPTFFELNVHFERRFRLRGYRWAFRMGANNIVNHRNPNTVNNNTASRQFLQFFGGQSRSINFRIRLLGKE